MSNLTRTRNNRNLPNLMRRYRGATWRNPVGEISQPEAARRMGVSVRTWQNWEIGHRTPRGLALSVMVERLTAAK